MNKYRTLITGGSRGIGAATAQLYRNAGRYDVFTPIRSELNLSNRSSIEEFIKKYREPGFDIIVNNAGDNIVNLIENVITDDIDYLVAVNMVAPLFLLRGFVPAMKERKFGRIVNISSIWSIVSKPGRVVYAATKHGIHGITMTLASELASYNILVNSVCPGFTMTELTKNTNTPEQIKFMKTQVPMGRLAEPVEIAKAIFFAGNEENTYMTGQKITVDGGYTSV